MKLKKNVLLFKKLIIPVGSNGSYKYPYFLKMINYISSPYSILIYYTSWNVIKN